MTTTTYFFVHHTGKVYRRDLLTNLLSELLIQRQSNQLVAQSTLVVAMTPLGTGKILKDREYRREDLTRDEMVVLSLQAESI